MQINSEDTAVVFIDPQNDVLSETGHAWPLVRESLEENNTIENMELIFRAAKRLGFEVFISPHYFYPEDKGWKFNGPLETDEANSELFARKGVLNLDGLKGSGADWLERDFYFFDAPEWDWHAVLRIAEHDSGGRRRGAGFVVACDVESHESGGAARHGEIGIAVVDPSANALSGAVGKWEIDVDDDAVVVECDGEGDRFGDDLRECGGDQDGRDEDSDSHGKIVAGRALDLEHRNLKSKIFNHEGR